MPWGHGWPYSQTVSNYQRLNWFINPIGYIYIHTQIYRQIGNNNHHQPQLNYLLINQIMYLCYISGIHPPQLRCGFCPAHPLVAPSETVEFKPPQRDRLRMIYLIRQYHLIRINGILSVNKEHSISINTRTDKLYV